MNFMQKSEIYTDAVAAGSVAAASRETVVKTVVKFGGAEAAVTASVSITFRFYVDFI